MLFDLDGVLIDSLPVYRDAWARWATRYGVDEQRIWQDAHGRRPVEIIARVAPKVDIRLAVSDFEATMATAIAKGAKALAGAASLLAELPGNEWAIVTSGYRADVVSLLGVAELLLPAVLVCGEDVADGKPNPECYELAARLLGVEPPDCLVVEDAPAGIEAAHRAGMEVIAVHTTHCYSDLAAADTLLADLIDALPIIAGWLSAKGGPSASLE